MLGGRVDRVGRAAATSIRPHGSSLAAPDGSLGDVRPEPGAAPPTRTLPVSRLPTPHPLGTAAVLSALTLALLAAPSHPPPARCASWTTTARARATNCDATTKAFKNIQKAVDASARR